MGDDVQQTERDRIRALFPVAAANALTRRAAAVRLYCVECMGGSVRDASTCEARDCFLWPHAYKRKRQGAAQAP